jgi:hypothetical protein
MHTTQSERIPMKGYLANKDAFQAASAPLLNEDGLLPCTFISVRKLAGRCDLLLSKNLLPIFTVPFNEMTTDYLVQSPTLWKQAAIRVTYHPSICGRAPVFGVPFSQAVKIALKQGQMRSRFYFPERIKDRRYETLLLQLDRTTGNGGKLLQLQAWQYSPGTHHAHYLHALSQDFNTHLCHLDGAVIEYSEDDLDLFLRKSRKVKGDRYEKQFRLDGSIEISHMHNLARMFFPTKELYDEAFEVAPSENLCE